MTQSCLLDPGLATNHFWNHGSIVLSPCNEHWELGCIEWSGHIIWVPFDILIDRIYWVVQRRLTRRLQRKMCDWPLTQMPICLLTCEYSDASPETAFYVSQSANQPTNQPKQSVSLANKEIFFCRAGGVELVAQKGKIKVVNTLESRLDLMGEQVTSYPDIGWMALCARYQTINLHLYLYILTASSKSTFPVQKRPTLCTQPSDLLLQMIPKLREMLFGVNSNRKFKD